VLHLTRKTLIYQPTTFISIKTTLYTVVAISREYTPPKDRPRYPSLYIGIEFKSLEDGINEVTDAILVEAYESYRVLSSLTLKGQVRLQVFTSLPIATV
jgi:hypothetical protein